MECKLKLALCLGLAGVWNAFGAANCSSSEMSQMNGYAAEHLSQIIGGTCTQQAALDAVNCLQNTCLQGKSASDQANCYGQYCGGTFCALSSSQATNFVNAYSEAVAMCNEPSVSMQDNVLEACVSTETGKQVPCSSQVVSTK